MTKKALATVAFALLLSMVLTASVFSTSLTESKRAKSMDSFAQFPTMEKVAVTNLDQLAPNRNAEEKPRWIPLGAAMTKAPGFGEVVDHTYDDYQWTDEVDDHVAVTQGTGMADIHFVYTDAPDTDSGTVRRGGYNVYDATDGSWPQTQDIGCLLQASENGGSTPGIAVFPDGLVVMDGFDSESGDVVPNHTFYYQEFPHDCNWLTAYVPQTTYTAVSGWADPDSTGFALPSIATQMNGTDKITHVFGMENGRTGSLDGGPWGAIQLFYFRKVGDLDAGTWTNGVLIDSTILFSGRKVVANQNSGDVALLYRHLSATGISEQSWLDGDLYLRESSDYGVSWGPKTNVTSFVHDGTETANSYSLSWGEDMDAIYDSNNDLHVVFTAMPIPIDPYDARTLFDEWGDFNCDILHWSRTVAGPNAGGTIVKVADGSYDQTLWNAEMDWNVYQCGFGPNLFDAQYITNCQLAQCDNHLYTVWGQIHSKLNQMDPLVDTTFADSILGHALDCQGERLNDNRCDGNWEIFVSVSTGLNGLLWDPARNLTNTITDTCWPDSGRACGDEYAVSMSAQPIQQTGGLVFPTNEVVPGGGTYAGDKWLNLTYIDDEYPSAWWTNDHDGLVYPASFNAVRWLRMACVPQVGKAIIDVSQGDLVWPNYVLNSAAVVYPVTVTNDGNLDLEISSIVANETGTATGWLSTSISDATVPAGVGNTLTFDMEIDPTSLTGDNWLDGTVTINSNADNTPIYIINIHMVAADEVEEWGFDTVATSTAWDSKGALGLGDNIALAVSNFGELGMGGEGGVNMDFTVDGGDCDSTATVYMFSGSPFILEYDGTNTAITTSLYRDNQADVCSFDPYPEIPMAGGCINDEYCFVSTGTMVSRDTAFGVIRRVITHHNSSVGNPSFVVVESKLYVRDGGTHTGVTFGDAIDWDVPADDGSENISGGTTPSGTGGMFLYLQGSDTTGHDGCQSNTNRYAAQAMLGWYTNAEFNANDSANNLAFHSAQGVAVRDYFDDPDGEYEPDADLWRTTVATSGITGQGTLADQGSFFTYVYDYTLAPTDTLTFYTLYATLRNGTLDDLKANVADARDWYWEYVRGFGGGSTCCTGPSVGNVDGSADNFVTMGDLTVLIDHLFISLAPLDCVAEGNVDLSTDGFVTMGDLTVLIDHLFISLNPLPPCPE